MNQLSRHPSGNAGVASGQALRVSVFNHHDRTQTFKIKVLGLDGKLLRSKQAKVRAHRGSFTDFDIAAGLKKGKRLQVHVDVIWLSGQPLGATVEVFDLKTGATRYPTDPCGVLAPDALTSMGSVGLIRHQIARVSLFQEAEAPQASSPYRIEIFGLDGKLLARQDGNLTPGRGVFVDWGTGSENFPKLKRGERLQIHVHAHVADRTTTAALLEIYDARTGETAYPKDPCY